MTSTWLLDSLSGGFWTLLAHDLHLYFARVKLLLETKHPLILPISIFYSSRFCQYKCDAMQLNGTLNMVHIQSVMTHMSTQNETPEKWRGRLFAHHAIPSRNNDTDLFNAICNVGKVNLNRQSLLSFNSTCLFNISSSPWVFGGTEEEGRCWLGYWRFGGRRVGMGSIRLWINNHNWRPCTMGWSISWLYLVSMISYPGQSDFLIKFRLTTENTKSQFRKLIISTPILAEMVVRPDVISVDYQGGQMKGAANHLRRCRRRVTLNTK